LGGRIPNRQTERVSTVGEGVDADAWAADVLREVGQRVTRPRVALLACVLTSAGEHFSANELLEQVCRTEPSIHRATVYRTLEGLANAGVLTHVHLERGLTAYHLSDDTRRALTAKSARRDGEPHLHAQCTRCGQVVDLPATVLVDAERRVRQVSGFRLDATHVALSGLCKNCA
jgi:Fur family transcriptional regulator, ferric uptake regulator